MCALNKVKGMNVYMKKKILISYVSYSNTSKSVAHNIYDKLDKKKYIVSLIDLSEYGSKINMFSNFLFKNNLELLSGLFLKFRYLQHIYLFL